MLGLVGIFVSFYKDLEKCFIFCFFFYFLCVDVVNVFGNFIGVIRNFVIIEYYFFCDLDDVCIG